MTDEGRIDQICQELFDRCQVLGDEAYNGITRAGIVIGVDAGYKAAVEAKRAVSKGLLASQHDTADLAVDLSERLEAERARSAKLIESLHRIAAISSEATVRDLADLAIDDYKDEASRD